MKAPPIAETLREIERDEREFGRHPLRAVTPTAPRIVAGPTPEDRLTEAGAGRTLGAAAW
jgi:hypothetical protein